jgi:hypothetical protein
MTQFRHNRSRTLSTAIFTLPKSLRPLAAAEARKHRARGDLARLALLRSGGERESFFPRIRRADILLYHRIAGAYLANYAAETARPDDNRRLSNGEQYLMAVNAALSHPIRGRWKQLAEIIAKTCQLAILNTV